MIVARVSRNLNVIFHISLQIAMSEMVIRGQIMSHQIFSGTIYLRLFKFYIFPSTIQGEKEIKNYAIDTCIIW